LVIEGPQELLEREGGVREQSSGPSWAQEVNRGQLTRRYIPPQHIVWQGNACRLLRDGVEAFPAMIDAIRAARRYVRLETYMFFDDAVGRVFARALAEAAARGVEVTVLYDALGSWTVRKSFYAELRAQGVDVRPFKPFSLKGMSGLIRRDHRKLLIVDGEVAFTGGINVAANWAPVGHGGGWRDDVLQIEGPVVHQLERCFTATWRALVRRRLWRLRELLDQRHARRGLQARGDVSITVLTTRRTIHRAYLHAINRATRSVLVVAGYFVPDRRMIDALRQAARRGVEVSLVLAGASDHPWLQYATHAYYDRLLAAGVRIYEWCHGVLHAKTAVVDGIWGTMGSFNLERTSLRLNYEANVVFVHPELGQELERSFRRDAEMCEPVDPAVWAQRPLWHRVVERVFYAFRRFI
jgi:cardiolipin synthase A/B